MVVVLEMAEGCCLPVVEAAGLRVAALKTIDLLVLALPPVGVHRRRARFVAFASPSLCVCHRMICYLDRTWELLLFKTKRLIWIFVRFGLRGALRQAQEGP